MPVCSVKYPLIKGAMIAIASLALLHPDAIRPAQAAIEVCKTFVGNSCTQAQAGQQKQCKNKKGNVMCVTCTQGLGGGWKWGPPHACVATPGAGEAMDEFLDI